MPQARGTVLKMKKWNSIFNFPVAYWCVFQDYKTAILYKQILLLKTHNISGSSSSPFRANPIATTCKVKFCCVFFPYSQWNHIECIGEGGKRKPELTIPPIKSCQCFMAHLFSSLVWQARNYFKTNQPLT